jgi:HAMP domain-containing protein
MAAAKKKSLLGKFNLLLIVFYLGSLVVAIPAVYWLTRTQTYQVANQELTLMVDMVKSLQGYVGQSLRAPLTEKNVFHPPALSGAVAINLVAGHFVKAQPDYYIKFTSDNPLNPKNKAMPLEQELLKRFRANGELKELVETGFINNKPYLVSARPNKATPECLTCHGDAAAVRTEITAEYGSTSGYGYTPGKVEGVLLVGVPIGNIDETVLQRSLGVIGIITALFTLFFLAANLLMKRSVITPLVKITEMAQAVSKGQLDTKMEIDRNDEIAALAHAFELMRRSLVAMLKRSRGA